MLINLKQQQQYLITLIIDFPEYMKTILNEGTKILLKILIPCYNKLSPTTKKERNDLVK